MCILAPNEALNPPCAGHAALWVPAANTPKMRVPLRNGGGKGSPPKANESLSRGSSQKGLSHNGYGVFNGLGLLAFREGSNKFDDV